MKSIQVPAGFDVADDRIVELIQPGDLAITADIPLAAKVVEKGAYAKKTIDIMPPDFKVVQITWL